MSPCCRLSFAVVAAVTVFVVVVNSSASKGNNNNSNESVDEIRTKTLLDDDVEIGKIVSIDCASVCAGVCVCASVCVLLWKIPTSVQAHKLINFVFAVGFFGSS